MRRSHATIVGLGLPLLLACAACELTPSTKGARPATEARLETSPGVIDSLRRITELRGKLVERATIMAEVGTVTPLDVRQAEGDLLQAQARLAEAEGRLEDAAAALEELVQARNEAVLAEQLKLKQGQAFPTDVTRVEVKASEARVLLALLLGDRDTLLGELRASVQTHASVLEGGRLLVETGVFAKGDLLEPEIALEEAKIRLAEAEENIE